MENTPNISQNSQNMNGTGVTSVEKKMPISVAEPKKANKTPFLIGAIVVLALCLAGAVTYGVIVTNQLREKEETAQGETGEDKTEKDETAVVPEKGEEGNGNEGDSDGIVINEQNADTEVQRIVALARKKVEELSDLYGGVAIKNSSNPDEMMVFYVPDGMITAVVLNKAYGFTLSDYTHAYDNLDVFYSEFTPLLINEGFKSVDDHRYTTASAGPGNEIFFNEKTGVVCNVAEFPLFACGYKTWYDTEDAALSNELAQVILEATGESPKLVVAEVGHIKDSEVSPYQNITVMRGGYASLLYRVSPDSSWQYFTSGQSGPLCSEYNTEDLRKAFAGFKCFSDEPGPMLDVKPEGM